MGLDLSSALFALISCRVLLGGSRLWFQISSLFGLFSVMRISQQCVSSVACLATGISIVLMLLSCLLTERNAEIGCWLVQKDTKSKLPTFRRWQLPNRKGNPRSLSLLSSILISKFHRMQVPVRCRLRTLHHLCCLFRKIPFAMVTLVKLLFLVFLFDAQFHLTYLTLISLIRWRNMFLITLIQY
ncbi:hypothetical protein LINGRAHAP2_LOCUS35136 [Linum grandiflorum]